MAKKLKPTDTGSAQGDPQSVDAVDLKRAIAEVSRLKEHASEASGQVGAMTNAFVERHGLDKNAFTFARRLHGMEEGKRASIIRASLEYWHKLGFFDQHDAFDPIADTLNAILDDLEANDNRSRQSADQAVVDGLIN